MSESTTKSMRPTISGALADFTTDYRPSNAASEALLKSAVDTIGCMIAGYREPLCDALRPLAAQTNGACAVLGTPDRASPADAAMVMGSAAHALDLDDYDVRSGGHPGVAIIPAAMAIGMASGASGAEVLAGIGAGYEAMFLLGLGFQKEAYQAGQHPTGTFGVMGAALAAGRVLGLDARRLRHALGIALAQSSGARANFGTMAKPFQAGNAARCGVLSAQLAQRGMTAADDPIGDPAGLVNLGVGSAQREAVLERMQQMLPRLGHFLDEAPPSIKLHAACGSTHGAIDAALELRDAAMPLEGIRDIQVNVPPVYMQTLVYPRARTGLEAKFSLEHSIALALWYGDGFRARYAEDAFAPPAVLRLRELVRMEKDPELQRIRDEQKCLPARLAIRTASGEHRTQVLHPLGSSGRPLDWAGVTAKFDSIASDLPADQRARVVDLLRNLPSLKNLAALEPALRPI